MAKFKASSAVLAGRARTVGASKTQMEWFAKRVQSKIGDAIKGRMGLVVNHLRNKTSQNIAQPVSKGSGGRVTNRSKGGEFPKADTTLLTTSIFGDVRIIGGQVVEGYVGTPLDYGVILETSKRLDRSFLLRTFNEERSIIKRILTGPIK